MALYTAEERKADPETQMLSTGLVEIYQADTQKEAAKKCLYTRRLADGNAYLGPSGYVIYSQGSCWIVTPEKKGREV